MLLWFLSEEPPSTAINSNILKSKINIQFHEPELPIHIKFPYYKKGLFANILSTPPPSFSQNGNKKLQ